MKLKSLIVVFAAALGLSGHASAAYIDGNDANGSSLILNVYDTVTKASFSELLAPQLGTFNSAATQTFTGGASTFASLFGSSSATNIRWEVAAVSTIDANIGNGPGDSGPWTTAFTSVSQPVSSNGAQVNNSGVKLNQWINLLNVHNTGGITSTTSSSDTWNMNNTSPGAPFGGTSGGGTLGFPIVGTGFGSLNFFTVTANGPGSTDPVTFAQILGNWSLASNGSLTWNAAQVGAVPVPAAVWLLGSGLFGLIGVARRRSNGGSEIVAA